MSVFHVLIPARYASTRLPGKPLVDIAGKPMIQRVVECAARSAAASVTVATDDERIARAVGGFGGAAIMTAAAHQSGTDRIAEAAEKLGIGDHEIIVNLQGDEPQMPASLIDQVAELLARQAADGALMATASAPLDAAQMDDEAVVKVVTDRAGFALYFSRAAIARPRDSAAPPTARRHLGIYAYRHAYLKIFAARPPCAPEKAEQLEQLRTLWHGEKIACAEAVETPPPGVDTPEDLARIRREIL